MSSFEKAIHDHAEKALLKMIGEGQFIMPDYRNRVPIPESFMRDVWNMLDLNVIKAKMADKLHDVVVDHVMNKLAQEIATDVKQVLSVTERREAIRAIARQHIDSIAKLDSLA